MTPRELSRAIAEATVCRVWVGYGPRGEGIYVDVSKRQAMIICDDARNRELDVDAEGGKVLSIGSEIEIDAEEEGPHAVCSECGEDFDQDHECSP